MALLPTSDPHCFIESIVRGKQAKVIYIVPKTGERWEIGGTCSMCGECWKGANGPAPTLDNPVRPEIKNHFSICTLTGNYLPSVPPA